MADTKYTTTLFTPIQLESSEDRDLIERVQNGDTEAFGVSTVAAKSSY